MQNMGLLLNRYPVSIPVLSEKRTGGVLFRRNGGTCKKKGPEESPDLFKNYFCASDGVAKASLF